MDEPCCSCHTKKIRSEQELKDLIARLNRIEGQIRGIRGMVERDDEFILCFVGGNVVKSEYDIRHHALGVRNTE